MTALALAFMAGTLTTLNPCVLPLLPVVLAASFEGNRLGPVAIAAGLALSFTVVGLVIGSAGFAIGLDSEAVRTGAALVMLAAGLILLSGVLQGRVAFALAPVAGRADSLLADRSGDGLRNEFLTGLLLGALWSPCAGPSLGAAIGLAAEAGDLAGAAWRMMAFGLGAGGVLVLLAYGARAVAASRQRLDRLARYSRPAMGWTFVLVASAVLSGVDKILETMLVDLSPEWLIDLTTRL